MDIEHNELLSGQNSEEPISAATPAADDAPEACLRLLRRIIRSIEDDGVEGGFNHAAEPLFRELLVNYGDDAVRCLSNAFSSPDTPRWVRPDLLRLLGRQEAKNVPSDWFSEVVRRALCSDEIQLRDAAVQAVELLQFDDALTILAEHKESSPWLADHMARVVRDLRGE